MSMNPDPKPFLEHKRKFVDTYALWRKSWEFQLHPLTEPRTCVEAMLKAFVVRYFSISECSRNNLTILKNRSEIDQRFSGDFGFQNALDIVNEKDSNLFSKSVLDKLAYISKTAINFTHTPWWGTAKEAIEVDQALKEVIEWFFDSEKEAGWYNTYIQPEIDRHAQSLLSQFSRGLVNEFTQQIEEKRVGSKIADSVIAVTADYWRVLSAQALSQRDHIQKQFFLFADDSFTHRFIALETIENPEFCDDVLKTSHKVNRVSIEEDLSFDGLLRAAFKAQTRALIQIFAPSGSGKSVFLAKIAYFYSHAETSLCDVFYVDVLDEQSILVLREKIDQATNPLLILIDTPSNSEEAIKTTWRVIKQSQSPIPFVVTIADQSDQYRGRLLRKNTDDFESPFKAISRLYFSLDPNETHSVYRKFESVIAGIRPEIVEIDIKSIFDNGRNLTVRERMRNVVTDQDIGTQINHVDDWVLFHNITDVPDLRKFQDLFPLVAIFFRFGISVPISLFDYGYIPGVSASDVNRFLVSDRDNIIRITHARTLEFRNDQITTWYFANEQHRRIAIGLFQNFLNNFREKADGQGCYLFRNVHLFIEKSFLKETLSRDMRIALFKGFVDKTPHDEFTKKDLAKAMMALSKLHGGSELRYYWLNRIIENDPSEYHAKTKKIRWLLDDKNISEAQEIFDHLMDTVAYDSYLADLEFRLGQYQEDRVATIFKRLQRLPHWNQMFNEVIRIRIKQRQMRDAELLMKEMGIRKCDLWVQMRMIRYYQQVGSDDKMLEILECLTDEKPNDVPAALLLSELHVKYLRFSLAEEALCRAREENSIPVVSVHLALAKLYRNVAFIAQNKDTWQSKTLNLFTGMYHELLMDAMQYRTEYAKWCYERHADDEKHREAESILLGTLSNFSDRHFHSRIELGLLYLRSNHLRDVDKAIKVLEEAYALDIDRKEFIPRNVLGLAYIEQNTDESWLKARKMLIESIAINEINNIQGFNTLQKVYRRLGEVDSLALLMGRISTMRSTSSKFAVSLSELHFLNGEIDQAIAIVEAKLIEDPSNPYLLNQAAKFIYVHLKRIPRALKNAEMHNMSLNKALEYLNKSLAEEPNNPVTLNICITVYDMFIYDENEQKQQYLETVQLRNNAVLKQYALHPNNVYFVLTLSKLLQAVAAVRAQRLILESVDCSNLPADIKCRVYIERKNVYIQLGDRIAVELLDKEVERIKNIFSVENVWKYNRHKISRRGILIEIWNRGTVRDGAASIIRHPDKKIFSFFERENPGIQLSAGAEVYFATYKIDERNRIFNVEPYFDRPMSENSICKLLPSKLNLA